MAPSPETQPIAVDYSGQPLHVGDTVAYIGVDPVRLCEGCVVVTAPRDICIESGPHLITFSGIPTSLDTPPPRPLDGTVRREHREGPLRYPQVALTGTESRHDVSLYVGDSKFPIDVAHGEVIRGSGPRIAVDELLAAMDRVRAFVARLEEFAEKALKDGDRKLYAVVASELRSCIDGRAEDGA
ncbi:hypothetical protein AB0R01_30775 [Streptomyces rochei]|uniref:hypothetical protein n=1 Tax=Streptomyces rochei TaxID=1928 RepID=UPI003422FE2A